MRITEGHFIVHYGPKGTPDAKCKTTGPIYSDESAVNRGLELKDEHGMAFITKRDRKGRVIGTFTPAAVPATA